MALLTRNQIIGDEARDDRDYETVACPEWGGEVRLRSITGLQRDAYEQSVIQGNGSDRKMNLRHARSKLIVLCAVDENDRLLFTPEDLNALSKKNAAPLDRLFAACKRLAGLSDSDVNELTEDFGAARSDEPTFD